MVLSGMGASKDKLHPKPVANTVPSQLRTLTINPKVLTLSFDKFRIKHRPYVRGDGSAHSFITIVIGHSTNLPPSCDIFLCCPKMQT
jgi:hypothetical protein